MSRSVFRLACFPHLTCEGANWAHERGMELGGFELIRLDPKVTSPFIAPTLFRGDPYLTYRVPRMLNARWLRD